jgi:hypothetical protein
MHTILSLLLSAVLQSLRDIHAGHRMFGSPAAKISKERRLRAPDLKLQ